MILGVAAALRAYDLFHLPFMHDELSALMRAQTGGFSELIANAKNSDVHPVGVHVLVHYWSALVGEREWLIKLPFLVFSVLAVLQAYRLAEKWINPTVGLLTASCMASLQFTVMYGQLERPYASGILLVLLLANALTDVVQGPVDQQKRALLRFSIYAALCAYNHYFSLLFAGIVGITGFFMVSSEKRKGYFLACLGAALLFLPHVGITLYQFSAGQQQGDWWISMPHRDWPFRFLKYLFHYSRIEYMVVFSLLMLSIVYRDRSRRLFYNYRVVAVLWSSLPFIIIYIYSKKVAPVLQLSSMTFSVPFILMGMFSFFGEVKSRLKVLLVVVLLVVNISTLYLVRKHYEVFYHQPYEQMARLSTKYINRFGAPAVLSIHRIPDGFMDYYERKYGTFYYERSDTLDLKSFLEKLQCSKADYLVAGNLPEEYLMWVRDYFPVLLEEQQAFTCEVRVYSKKKSGADVSEGAQTVQFNDYSAQGGLSMDSLAEFGMNQELDLKKVLSSRYSILEIEAELGAKDSVADPMLVYDAVDGKDHLQYLTAKCTGNKGTRGGVLRLAVPLYDFQLDKLKSPLAKIYVWNPGHGRVNIRSCRIQVRPTNPYIYGLYEAF